MNPMMTVDDQRVLLDVIDNAPDDAVFVEFGGGGSSLMFASRLKDTQRLITIDHNPEWYEKIATAIAPYQNAEVHLITPKVPANFHPFGHPYEEVPMACTSYIHALGVDIPWDKVSCVLVDGIARGAVMAAVRTKLKPLATVLIHDYIGREEWYDWAVELYDIVEWQFPRGTSADRDEDGQQMPNTLLRLRVPA